MSSNLNWSGNKGLDPGASSRFRPTFAIPSETRDYSKGLLSSHGPATGQQSTAPSQHGATTSPGTTSAQQRQQDPTSPLPMQQRQQDPTSPLPMQQEPIMDMQGPPPATEEGFIPAYLRRNLGKNVRAEFIIGTSQYTDRIGRLIEVGINYFVLEDVNSRTHIMCDLYSVKFVTVLQT